MSPVDKGGYDVTPFYGVQGAPGGGAIAFGAVGAFPGSQASATVNPYLSTRGLDGWSTRPLLPPQINPSPALALPLRDFSQDLGLSVVVSLRALTPEAVEGDGNIYIQDNATGEVEFVTSSDDRALFNEFTAVGTVTVQASTADYGHVVFQTTVPLTPDAPAAYTKVYELHDGQVRLVSVGEDGLPLPPGPTSAYYSWYAGTSGLHADPRNNTISANGRHIFVGNGDRLYRRTDGATTVEISKPEPGAATSADDQRFAKFRGASADGSTVFFDSAEELSEDATPADPEAFPATRLYRWKDGDLTEIHAGPPVFGFGDRTILDLTDDGETVYFRAAEMIGGQAWNTIAVWREGEGVRRVAQLGDAPGGPMENFERWSFNWAMADDGSKLAFTALREQTDRSTAGPCSVDGGSHGTLEGHCIAAYLYDHDSGEVECVSCGPPGTVPAGHATIGGQYEIRSGPIRTFSEYRPRGMTEDGTVYFDTATRLVPDDLDLVRDVYAWRDGELTLMTPNTEQEAMLADTSQDGTDVFVLTSDPLVGQDADRSIDLYTVRVGGGLPGQNPSPPPSPCGGDACQGPQRPEPPHGAAGSQTFRGKGNVEQRGRPAARLAVGKRRIGRGGSATLRVRVSSAGRIAIRGRLLRKAGRALPRAGVYKVRVRLRRPARRALARRGRITSSARVVFTPRAGGAVRKRVTITFKPMRAGR